MPGPDEQNLLPETSAAGSALPQSSADTNFYVKGRTLIEPAQMTLEKYFDKVGGDYESKQNNLNWANYDGSTYSDPDVGASPILGSNIEQLDYNHVLSKKQKQFGFNPSKSYEDLNQERIDERSYAEWGLKFAGKLGLGTLNKMAEGLVYVGAYVNDEMVKTATLGNVDPGLRYNNPLSEALESTYKGIQWMTDMHTSQQYRNATSMWDKVLTSDFAHNEASEGIQFFASMFGVGGAIKALGKAKQMTEMGSFLMATAVSTVSEASLEAKGVYDDVKKIYEGKIDPKTGAYYTKEQIEALSKEAGDRTFRANASVLALTNAIPLKMLFPKASFGAVGATQRIRNNVMKGQLNPTVWKEYAGALGSGVLGTMSEMSEENFQTAVGLMEKDYASGKLSEWELSNYGTYFADGVGSLGKGLAGQSLSEREMEQSTSAFLGGLIGAPSSFYGAYQGIGEKREQYAEVASQWKKMSTQMDAGDKMYFDSDRMIFKTFEKEVDVLDEKGNPTGKKTIEKTHINPATGAVEVDQEKANNLVYNTLWQKKAFDRIASSALEGDTKMQHVNRAVAVSQLAYNYYNMFKSADWKASFEKLFDERFKAENEGKELTQEERSELNALKEELLDNIKEYEKIDKKLEDKSDIKGTPLERRFNQSMRKALYLESAKRKGLEQVKKEAQESGDTKLVEMVDKMLEDSYAYEKHAIENKAQVRKEFIDFKEAQNKELTSVMELSNKISKATDASEKALLEEEQKEMLFKMAEKGAVESDPYKMAESFGKNANEVMTSKPKSAEDKFYQDLGYKYKLDRTLDAAGEEIDKLSTKVKTIDFEKPLSPEDETAVNDLTKNVKEMLDAVAGMSEYTTKESHDKYVAMLKEFDTIWDELRQRDQRLGLEIEKADRAINDNLVRIKEEEAKNAEQTDFLEKIHELQDEIGAQVFEDFTLTFNRTSKTEDIAAYFNDLASEMEEVDEEELEIYLESVNSVLGTKYTLEDGPKAFKEIADKIGSFDTKEYDRLKDVQKNLEQTKADAEKLTKLNKESLNKFEEANQSGARANEAMSKGVDKSVLKEAEEAKAGALRKKLQKDYAKNTLDKIRNEKKSHDIDPEAYSEEKALSRTLDELQTIKRVYEKERKEDTQEYKDFIASIDSAIQTAKDLIQISRQNEHNKKAAQGRIFAQEATDNAKSIGVKAEADGKWSVEDQTLYDLYAETIGKDLLKDMLDSAESLTDFAILADLIQDKVRQAPAKERGKLLDYYKNKADEVAKKLEELADQSSLGFKASINIVSYLSAPVRGLLNSLIPGVSASINLIFQGEREGDNPLLVYNETESVTALITALEKSTYLKEQLENDPVKKEQVYDNVIRILNFHKEYIRITRAQDNLQLSGYTLAESHLLEGKTLLSEAGKGNKIVPTKEQTKVLRQIVRALSSKLFAKATDRKDLARGIVFLKGPAGSGKTKIVLRFALKAFGIKTKEETYAFSHKDATSKGIADSVGGVQGSLEEMKGKDLSKVKVMVVDEAPFFDNKQLESIFEKFYAENERRLAEKKPLMRLVILGDPGQITKEGSNSILYQINKHTRINVVDPLTQVYRSEVPSIINIQKLFRNKSVRVQGAQVTSNVPQGTAYDAKNKPIGVQAGLSTTNLIDAVAANKDSQRTKVIIVNTTEDKAQFENSPQLKGIQNLEILTYDEAQGQTFQEVYVALNREGKSMEGKKFSDNLNETAFNKAMYTALSRASEFIFMVAPSFQNFSDPNLTKDTDKSAAQTEENFSEYSERIERESQLISKFDKNYEREQAEAKKEEPVKVEDPVTGETRVITDNTEELAPDEVLDPDTPTLEELQEASDTGVVDENDTEENEIEETKPEQLTNEEEEWEDAEDFADDHELAFPNNNAGKPSQADELSGERSVEARKGGLVIYVRTNVGGMSKLRVYTQAFKDGVPTGQWIELGVINTQGLKEDNTDRPIREEYEDSPLSSDVGAKTLTFDPLTGTFDNQDFFFSQDADGNFVINDQYLPGKKDSAILKTGYLKSARTLGYRWTPTMPKSFKEAVEQIKNVFRMKFFKDSSVDPDYSIKVFSTKEVNELKRQGGFSPKAGVPYMVIENKRGAGKPQFIRLSPKKVMKNFQGISNIQNIIRAGKALRDNPVMNGLTIGFPIVNELIKNFANARNRDTNEKSFELDANGLVIYSGANYYTYEQFIEDAQKYPELKQALESIEGKMLTKEQFDLIQEAAIQIVPEVYGSREVRRTFRIMPEEVDALREKLKNNNEQGELVQDDKKTVASDGTVVYYLRVQKEDPTLGTRDFFATERVLRANSGPAQSALNTLSAANSKMKTRKTTKADGKTIFTSKKLLATGLSNSEYRANLIKIAYDFYVQTEGVVKATIRYKDMSKWETAHLEASIRKHAGSVLKDPKVPGVFHNAEELLSAAKAVTNTNPITLDELEEYFGEDKFDADGNSTLEDNSYLHKPISKKELETLNKKLHSSKASEKEEALEELDSLVESKFDNMDGAKIVVTFRKGQVRENEEEEDGPRMTPMPQMAIDSFAEDVVNKVYHEGNLVTFEYLVNNVEAFRTSHANRTALRNTIAELEKQKQASKINEERAEIEEFSLDFADLPAAEKIKEINKLLEKADSITRTQIEELIDTADDQALVEIYNNLLSTETVDTTLDEVTEGPVEPRVETASIIESSKKEEFGVTYYKKTDNKYYMLEDGQEEEVDKDTYDSVGLYYSEEGKDQGRSMTESQARKLVNSFFKGLNVKTEKSWLKAKLFSLLGIPTGNEVEIKFVSQAILDSYSGKVGKVKGMYLNGIIYLLSENKTVKEKVLRHEVFHKIFNEMLTKEERTKLRLAAGRVDAETRNMSTLEFEEWAADSFADFTAGSKTFKGRLLNFFNNIARMFGFVLQNRNELEQMFSALDKGYFTQKLHQHPTTAKNYLSVKESFVNVNNLRKAIHLVQAMYGKLTTYNPEVEDGTKVYNPEEVYIKIQHTILTRIAMTEKALEREMKKPSKNEDTVNQISHDLLVLNLLSNEKNLSVITDYLFPDSTFKKNTIKVIESDQSVSEVDVIEGMSEEEMSFMETLEGVNLKDVIDNQESKDSEGKLSTSVKFLLSNIKYKGKWLNPRFVFAKMLKLMEGVSFEENGGENFLNRFKSAVAISAGVSIADLDSNLDYGPLRAIYLRVKQLYLNSVSPHFNEATFDEKRKEVLKNSKPVDSRIIFLNKDSYVIYIGSSRDTNLLKKLNSMYPSELSAYIYKNPTEFFITNREKLEREMMKDNENEMKRNPATPKREAFFTDEVMEKLAKKLHAINDSDYAATSMVNGMLAKRFAAIAKEMPGFLKSLFAQVAGAKTKEELIAAINEMTQQATDAKVKVPNMNVGELVSSIMKIRNNTDKFSIVHGEENILEMLRAGYRSVTAKNTMREFSTLFSSLREKNMYVAEVDPYTGQTKYTPIGTSGTHISVHESIVDSILNVMAGYDKTNNTPEQGVKNFKNSEVWKNISKLLKSQNDTEKSDGVRQMFELLGMSGLVSQLKKGSVASIAEDFYHLFNDHLNDAGRKERAPITNMSQSELEQLSPEEIEDLSKETMISLDYLLDSQGSALKRISKEVASNSQYLRPSSVKDVAGNTVYLHHNSSQGDDLIVLMSNASSDKINSTGKMSSMRIPKFLLSKFFQLNPFVGARNAINKIHSIIDHDGIKNIRNDKGTSYTAETKSDWYSRYINLGFVEMVMNSPATVVKYAQWIYTPAHRPKIKGAIVNVLSENEIKNSIGRFVAQMLARPNLKGIVERFDPTKDTNFEIFSKALAVLNIPVSEIHKADPTTVIDAMYDELTKLSRLEAEKLVEEKFVFSKNFNKAYNKLIAAGLLPKDTAKSPLSGGDSVKTFRKEENYPHSVDQVHVAIDLMFKNNYVNSYFLNQVVAGDNAFFNGSLDMVKRMSGVFAPGQKGLVNNKFGMRDKFRIAIMKDTREGLESIQNFVSRIFFDGKDYSKLDDKQKKEIESLLERFGDDYKPDDGQGFMLPERAEELSRGFGDAYQVGRVSKGAHYENVVKTFKIAQTNGHPLFYSKVSFIPNKIAKENYAAFNKAKDFDKYFDSLKFRGKTMQELKDDNYYLYKRQLLEAWDTFNQEARGAQVVTSNRDLAINSSDLSHAFTLSVVDDTLAVANAQQEDLTEEDYKLNLNAANSLIKKGVALYKNSKVLTTDLFEAGKSKDTLKEGQTITLDSAGKPAIYEEAVVPVMVKYSSVVLSDELIKAYPQLRMLREKMRLNKVGEVVLTSGVKVGGPKDMMVSDTARLSKDSLYFPENSVYELSNENYRLQSNPDHSTFDSKKGVANPSQLGYFLSVLQDLYPNQDNATAVYEAVSMLIQQGWTNFQELVNENGVFSPQKFAVFVKNQMTGAGNERMLELLESGVNHNAPHIVNKALSQLASKIVKSTVGTRFPGEKLTLQSSYGIRLNAQKYQGAIKEMGEDVINSGRELKYSVDENGRMTAEVIIPRGLFPKEVEKQLLEGNSHLYSDAMGFRIPSTELHSAVALKVVGFYDSRGSSMVIAPKELVPLHGSDFDVDSLFVLVRSYFGQKELDTLSKYGEVTERKPGKEEAEGKAQTVVINGKTISINKIIGHSQDGKSYDHKGLLEVINSIVPLDEKDKKFFDNLREKILLNTIVDAFIENITAKENRKRMLSPISMTRFNGSEEKDGEKVWLKGTVFKLLSDLQKKRAKAQKPGLTKEEEKEAGELQKRVDLSTWAGNYAVFKSNMDGLSLVGVFANAVKSLSYMIRSGSTGEETIANIENVLLNLKLKKESIATIQKEEGTVINPDVIKGIDEMIKELNAQIKIIKKFPDYKTKFPPMLSQDPETGEFNSINLLGKRFMQLSENSYDTDGNITEDTTWDVLDSLINAAIDNVKEQILPIINANGATSNSISAMLSLGIPLDTVVVMMRQSSIEAINTNGNKLIEAGRVKNQVLDAYLERAMTKEVMKGLSKDEMAAKREELLEKVNGIELTQEVLENLFINGEINFNFITTNLDKALSKVVGDVDTILLTHAKVMIEFAKAAKIGEDIAAMSSALNILRTHPSDYASYEALQDKWDTIAEEDEKGNLVPKENFSFSIPNFFKINPHIGAAFKVFQGARDLIAKGFLKHDKSFTAFIKDVYKEVKVGLAKNKHESTNLIKDDFIQFLFSSIDLMSDIPFDSKYSPSKGRYEGVTTKVGPTAWSNNFAEKVKTLKEVFLQKGISNSFLETLSVRYNPDPTITFTAGNNLQFEDVLMLQEDFNMLINYEFDNGKLENRSPRNASEFSELQHDFVRYAITQFGMKFSSSNYSLILPADIIAPYVEQMTAKLKDIVENETYSDYKELFEHQLAVNRGTELETVSQLPVKSEGENASSTGVTLDQDGKKIYYSLKFEVQPGRGYPKYMVYGRKDKSGNRREVYRRVETEDANHIYYVKIGKAPSKPNYMLNSNLLKNYSPLNAFNPYVPHAKVESLKTTEVTLAKAYKVEKGTIISVSLLDDFNRIKLVYYKIDSNPIMLSENEGGTYQDKFRVVPAMPEEVEAVKVEEEAKPNVELSEATRITSTNASYSNPAPHKESGMAKVGNRVSVKEALTMMAREGSVSGKALASLLLDRYSELLNDLEINYYHEPKKTRGGFYSTGDVNTIHVAVTNGPKKNLVSNETIEHVLLHELVHALTVRAIDKPRNDQERRAVRRLEMLFKEVKKRIKNDGKGKHYGLTNLYEFVAEALTNPEFQKTLDSYKVSNRHENFWDWFKSILSSLFGIELSQKSALSAAMEDSFVLFSNVIEKQEEAQEFEIESKDLSPFVQEVYNEAQDYQVSIDANGNELDTYENVKTKTLFQRISDQATGFLSNFMRGKKGKDPVQDNADRMWKNAAQGDETKLPISSAGLELTKQEYIEFAKKNQEKGKMKGKIIHKVIEIMLHDFSISKKTKQELREELAELYKKGNVANPTYSYGWVPNVLPGILEKLGINVFNTEIPVEKRDKVMSEVTVGNELLGYAGTIDMLVEHPDGKVSILDWKSGNTFDEESMSMLLKYGNQNSLIFDDPKHKAHLQLVMYAVMLKAKNPNVKFKDLAAVWIPNKYEAEGYSPNSRISNVEDYLKMIELYLKNEQKDTYAKLLQTSPQLFNAKEYSGTAPSLEQKMIDEKKTAQQVIQARQEELKLIIQSNLDIQAISPEEMNQIVKLTKELVEFSNNSGYPIKDWSEDISEMSKNLGAKTDVNHPLVRIYRQVVEEALDNANSAYLNDQREFNKRLKAVMVKRAGILGLRLNKLDLIIGGFRSYKGLYDFAYKLKEVNGTTVYTLKTRGDKEEWDALSKEEQDLLDFVNERFGSFFTGPDAFLNRQAVAGYGAYGKDLSDLQLYNEGQKDVDKFQYYEGFLPIVPPTMTDIRERYGMFSKEYWKNLYYKNMTFHYEYEFERWDPKGEAIPIRYLGTRAQRSYKSHTMNLNLTFDRYMKAMYHKKFGDNAHALSRGMQLATKLEGSRMSESRISEFLDKHVDMELLHKSQRPFDLGKKTFLSGTFGQSAKGLNVFKVVESMGNFTSGAIMWLKPFAGLRNAASAGIMTKKEAIMGSIGGRLIDKDAYDFTEGELLWGMKEALGTLVSEAINGNLRNNKLYLMMEEFRFRTTAFELATEDRFLMTVKQSILGGDMMYLFHSAPEEVLAGSILAAQMMHRKVDMPDGSKKSMWSLYKVENGKLVYTGPVRGKIKTQVKGEYIDLKGVTSDESAMMREVYKRIHGGYRRGEKTMLDWYLFGRLMGQFKKFLPNLLKTTFESRGKSNTLGAYKQTEVEGKTYEIVDGMKIPLVEWQQRVIEGRWRTVGGALAHYFGLMNLIGGKATSNSYAWNNLEPMQKRNLFEAAVSIAGFFAMYALWLSAFADTDDDDSWKKWSLMALDNASQHWNPLSIAKDTSKFFESASMVTTFRTLKSVVDMGLAAFVSTGVGGEEAAEDAYTEKGELRGWSQFKRGIPLVASYYDAERFIDGIDE
jgi:hypothetical protein